MHDRNEATREERTICCTMPSFYHSPSFFNLPLFFISDSTKRSLSMFCPRIIDPWFALFMCFVFPGLVCTLWGDNFWNGYWVAGGLRYIFVLHATWSVKRCLIGVIVSVEIVSVHGNAASRMQQSTLTSLYCRSPTN